MDTNELRNPKEVSTVWVKYLQQEVEYHNNEIQVQDWYVTCEGY